MTGGCGTTRVCRSKGGTTEYFTAFHGWSSDFVIIPWDSSVMLSNIKAMFRAGCHEVEEKTEFSSELNPAGDKLPFHLHLHTSRYQQIGSTNEAKENIPFTCKYSSFPSPSPLCSSQSWTEQAGTGCWGIKRWTDEFRQVSSGWDEVVCLPRRTQILTFIYSQTVAPKLWQLQGEPITSQPDHNKWPLK